MYWQVDGGTLVEMPDSYADYPHKEAIVDLTNWNWKGSGPYVITFVIKDLSGNVKASANRNIYVDVLKPATSASSATTSVATPAFSIIGKKLYVDQNNSATIQANLWRLTKPYEASLLDKIGNQSQSVWLGSWMSNDAVKKTIQSTLAAASLQKSIPTFVLYNIPQRDCGSYSAGGANNTDGYKAWTTMVTDTIGSSEAIVIVEPDALTQISCLSSADQSTRISLISDAVSKLKAKKNIAVYIDAGHSNWIDASTMSSRLKSAGIAKADGFALNVSNYQNTSDNTAYGKSLSDKIGAMSVSNGGTASTKTAHFIIDTSRNGAGPASNSEWCNPSGRALGQKPTTSTGNSLIDAYLWIKKPGESDGTCNGGPSAGVWWNDYAIGLASRASW